MPPYTQRTLRSSEEFFEDLRRVQERGFALDEQELEEGINAVAAPVLDLSDQPIASVAVAGPAYRLTRERLLEIGPLVMATAQDIAREVEMAADPEGG
jgi:DNA-binding IclR family transcriptional regulator